MYFLKPKHKEGREIVRFRDELDNLFNRFFDAAKKIKITTT